MEEALEALGQQFQSVAKDLSVVSQRLQCEFSSSSGPNPAGILKRLRNISTELPTIRKECDAIFAEKQALVDAAKQTLIPSKRSMGEILQALESTGTGDNSEEALQNALEHWNRSISQYFASSTESTLMDRATLDRKMFEMAAESLVVKKSSSCPNKENQTTADAPKARVPTKRLSQKTAPGSVTQDEFDKLSSIVKGKCHLGGVNELLAVLLNYFAGNPEKKCISTPQLIALGGKIKHAGDKKLGVLRTLKMIQITKSGIEMDKKALKTPRKVSCRASQK